MFAPSQLNELTEGFKASLADDLDQHSLAPPPVELAVEDLLPRAENTKKGNLARGQIHFRFCDGAEGGI